MEKQHISIADTGLFAAAKQAKKLPNFVVVFFLGFLIMIVGSVLGLLGELFQLPDYLETSIFTLTIGFGSSTLLCFLYVKKVEKRPISTMGFGKESALRKYMIGFGIAAAFMTFCVLAGTLLGGFEINTAGASTTGIKTLIPVLFMLFGFVIQGGTEEVITRGWILPVIGARYNVTFGVILSTAIFTLLHGMNPGMTVLPIVNLTLFALFAALYVIYTGNLWGICGFHTAWNWFQGNIFGIKVSGNSMAGGSIFSFDFVNGFDLVSGGIFGVEGGLICTFVYLVGIGYLGYRIAKKMKIK